MASKSFNGHESWTAWNVSLWVNNDEGLYRMARHYSRFSDGPARMMNELSSMGMDKTPDGAKFSKHSLKLAMREM